MIQPAAGDAGGSLGAALALWHIQMKKDRKINESDQMNGSYLGPEFDEASIKKEFDLIELIIKFYLIMRLLI